MRDVITYPLPNFNSATVNVWELMRRTQTVRYNKIAHFAIPIEYDLSKQGFLATRNKRFTKTICSMWRMYVYTVIRPRIKMETHRRRYCGESCPDNEHLDLELNRIEYHCFGLIDNWSISKQRLVYDYDPIIGIIISSLDREMPIVILNSIEKCHINNSFRCLSW